MSQDSGGHQAAKVLVFRQLKPICSQLLQPSNDARLLGEKLGSLHSLLVKADKQGLQACSDYVMFPLFLLLDSFLRSKDLKSPSKPGIIAAKSVGVAEKALKCLSSLLQRCRCNGEEALNIIERLSLGLELPRDSISEEVRQEVLLCLSRLLSNSDMPPTSDARTAPVIGYTAHLLLRTADAEVAADLKGSKTVRLRALEALEHLIHCQGQGHGTEILAFLLPGLVSGIGKQLSAAGASASGQATQVAIKALVALICTLMKDTEEPNETTALTTIETAVRQLHVLEAGMTEGKPLSADHPKPTVQPARSEAPSTVRREVQLRVRVDSVWKAAAAEKLQGRLPLILTPLQGHPQVQVREVLAQGIIQLLQLCPASLAGMRKQLMQIVYALAQDKWEAVHKPCTAFLRSLCQPQMLGSSPTAAQRPEAGATSELCLGLFKGLRASLERGEQEGIQQARQLITALQIAASSGIQHLLRNPGQLSVICDSLLQCFAFEPTGASLLVYKNPQSSYLPHRTASKIHDSSNDKSEAAVNGVSEGSAGGGPVVLPRMPMGLSLVSSEATYDALSSVCRVLGRLASCEGAVGLHILLGHVSMVLSRASSERSTRQPAWYWQCTAASAITMLAETAYGTCPDWRPTVWLDALSESPPPASTVLPLLEQVQGELCSAALWNESSNACSLASHDALAAIQQSPQDWGVHVMLIRTLLDATGTIASILKSEYAGSGPLLQNVLLPVLECLGDPCSGVSYAAEEVLAVICASCGYSGLSELVAQNLDYIVDGICAQLRNMEANPKAPALFAVLLKRAGVAPRLLSLLAEPARASVQNLGIMARSMQPGNVNAFLASLKEIALGAEEEAGLAAGDMQSIAEATSLARDELKSARREGEQNTEAGEPSTSKGSHPSAEAFFRQHIQDKERGQGLPENSFQVVWTPEQWAASQHVRQRMHTAATILASAARAASPLLMSKDLQTVLLSMDLSCSALRGLGHITAAMDIQEHRIEPYVAKRSYPDPVAPEIAKVLPHVHQLWAPLLAALEDTNVAVVEKALECLVNLVEVGGGDFLRRRMRKEGWPVLAKLLQQGLHPKTSTQPGILSARRIASSQVQAPAILARVRVAVVSALDRIALSKKAKGAVEAFVADIATALVPFMADDGSHALKIGARKAIVNLAGVDPDAVWAVLARLAASGGCMKPPAEQAPAGVVPWSELFPGSHKPPTPGQQSSIAAVAAALMEKIKGIKPPWLLRAAADAAVDPGSPCIEQQSLDGHDRL